MGGGGVGKKVSKEYPKSDLDLDLGFVNYTFRGGWLGVGKCITKENPKSDLDLDLGFVN